jgi:drug/metabolite transporter (DMT)-like permease
MVKSDQLSDALMGVFFSVVGAANYSFIALLLKEWRPDYPVALVVALSACLLVALATIADYRRRLKRLGFVAMHPKAAKTDERGLREAHGNVTPVSQLFGSL